MPVTNHPRDLDGTVTRLILREVGVRDGVIVIVIGFAVATVLGFALAWAVLD